MGRGRDGDHRSALREHQRALRIRRATRPAEHGHIAWSTLGVAMEARELGEHSLVVEVARPLMTSPAPARLPDEARVVLMMMFGEEALLETGRLEEAVE